MNDFYTVEFEEGELLAMTDTMWSLLLYYLTQLMEKEQPEPEVMGALCCIQGIMLENRSIFIKILNRHVFQEEELYIKDKLKKLLETTPDGIQ